MWNRVVVLLALTLVLATAVSAADIAGKWTAQIPSRSGQTREATFTFKVDGDRLTGTMTAGQGREVAISEGKVSGATLSFVVTTERGGETMKQTYTGKIAGDEIQFKRESGQGAAREFVAKRAR